MSIVQKLTENIVERDLQKEGAALLNKWEKTGLLEGLNNENQRNGMARLLENQAKELLREASTMSAGDVEGFAAVAFPIVRRVFGGLIANDLVSVQPMSLPSGLIFFLDFTYTDDDADGSQSKVAPQGASVYGGGQVAKGIASGVDLSNNPEKGFFALNNSYSAVTGTAPTKTLTRADNTHLNGTKTVAQVRSAIEAGSITDSEDRALALKAAYDPDLSEDHYLKIVTLAKSDMDDFDDDNLVSVQVISASGEGAFNVGDGILLDSSNNKGVQHRRLTSLSPDGNSVGLVFTLAAAFNNGAETDSATINYARRDDYAGSTAPGSVIADLLGLEGAGGGTGSEDINSEDGSNADIREIDIKVDSLAVTAQTRKLKAKWSPELGQDLNAYHNLDAEVELTSILSEHVALEIDREIMEDLMKKATAATLHWSRHPGKFLNRETGKEVGATTAAPDFTGTVSEWYETLIETINDVSAQIHRKTLRGGANFVVCSPEVANILEFTAGFRASVTADADRGSIGAQKVGSVSQKFEVYVDPYFPRNVILVGRKGSSFLESGYVYAPYVPLQVTPTIFGTEDFVPRKGVMTRYAKKMVRPDMYGLVVCHDLVG